VHQALQAPAQSAAESAALVALLGEQRRTNRLLQALLFGALGFLAGIVLVRVWLHWWPA
jgi:ubiquinone biosynthesis protein